MTRVTIQMGHCFRRSGATGTAREQEFASTVGPKLRDALVTRGHAVKLIGADDAMPAGDVFIALHTDGSASTSRRGASVGYPSTGGRVLAAAWKRRHQEQGFPGGWLADNYTPALAGYYGYGKATAALGYDLEFLAEHGTTTNASDRAWLFNNIGRCVQAHVDAIGDVVGHPNGATAQTSWTPGTRVLRYRPSPDMFSGEDVKVVQRWASVSPVDGHFGLGTTAAVVAKQMSLGMVADGAVGPVTWAVVLKTGQTPAPTPSTSQEDDMRTIIAPNGVHHVLHSTGRIRPIEPGVPWGFYGPVAQVPKAEWDALVEFDKAVRAPLGGAA